MPAFQSCVTLIMTDVYIGDQTISWRACSKVCGMGAAVARRRIQRLREPVREAAYSTSPTDIGHGTPARFMQTPASPVSGVGLITSVAVIAFQSS